MLEIIDTAGTEQFTSMVEMYIRNCQGFILVYDVTKKTSFEGMTGIKDLVFKTTKTTAKNPPPMIVVGNKTDDPDREVLFAQGECNKIEKRKGKRRTGKEQEKKMNI